MKISTQAKNALTYLLISSTLIASSLFGPAANAAKSFVLPTGEKVTDIACRSKQEKCFKKASKLCKGEPYTVAKSWSNAGGLIADKVDGPYTWYHMYVSCGKSDGVMPDFPHLGKRENGMQKFADALTNLGKALEPQPIQNQSGNLGGGTRQTISAPQGPTMCNLVSSVRGNTTANLSLNNNSGIQPASSPTACSYRCQDGTSRVFTTQGVCPANKWSNGF